MTVFKIQKNVSLLGHVILFQDMWFCCRCCCFVCCLLVCVCFSLLCFFWGVPILSDFFMRGVAAEWVGGGGGWRERRGGGEGLISPCCEQS